MKPVMRPVGDDDLQAHVDGRLAAERRTEVDAYLAEQPEVAARVLAYVAQRDALREAYRARADEPLPAQLRIAHIAATVRGRRTRRFSAITAAAAWLVVGATGGWLAHTVAVPAGAPTPQVVAAERPMEDALVAFRVFTPEVRHPVEVGADERAHLQTWLSKRVGRKLVAPDLNAAGYRLLGGRLLAATTGPAALFMYESGNGERMTVYIRSSPDRAEAPVRFRAENGLGAAYWYDGGYGFAVVSKAVDRESLTSLARRARSQLTT